MLKNKKIATLLTFTIAISVTMTVILGVHANNGHDTPYKWRPDHIYSASDEERINIAKRILMLELEEEYLEHLKQLSPDVPEDVLRKAINLPPK